MLAMDMSPSVSPRNSAVYSLYHMLDMHGKTVFVVFARNNKQL